MSPLCKACAWLFLVQFGLSAAARADNLEITSTPSGATVEIDGVAVGTTPYSKDFPGGYFHRTRTALGSRLEHAMGARIRLAGYATKEVPLSQGPINQVGLNGRNHGECWLLKSTRFHADLEPIDAPPKPTGFGTITTRSDPDGAEIYVDEKFVGNSPASLKLRAGTHTIAVR
jgi:PEGA domain